MEKRRYVSCTGDIRDAGSIPGLERSPGGQRGNHSSLLPGESHGRRSLVGHSPQGHTESDSTEATWHAGAPRPPWPSLSSWVNVSLALYSIVVGFVAGWCPQLVRCHHGHGVVLPLAACCGLAFQALWRCCSPLPSSCCCLPGCQPPFCTCRPPPKAAVEVTGSDGSRQPHKRWGAFHRPRHPVEAGPPAVWVLCPAALICQVNCVVFRGPQLTSLMPLSSG